MTATVSDPLGRPIEALFPLADTVAIVETAAASGLGLVVPDERDAFAASTAGTGAIVAIERGGGLDGVRLVVLCDVRTTFVDAARVFGPQKGASAADVRRLQARPHALARRLDPDSPGASR